MSGVRDFITNLGFEQKVEKLKNKILRLWMKVWKTNKLPVSKQASQLFLNGRQDYDLSSENGNLRQ